MLNIIAPAFSELVRRTEKCRVMNDPMLPARMALEDEEMMMESKKDGDGKGR